MYYSNTVTAVKKTDCYSLKYLKKPVPIWFHQEIPFSQISGVFVQMRRRMIQLFPLHPMHLSVNV